MSSKQPEWGNVAESYEAWYQTRRGRRHDEIERGLIDGLLGPPRGERLLEIGCGTGHFARWFRELRWKVWGLDLEARMLVWARKHSERDIVYCRGDAERLPFPDNAFHISALITTLESTSHPERVLAEAMRVSREMVILGVLNSWSLLALWRRLRSIFRPTIFSQTRFYSGPALCAIIRRVSRQMGVPVSLKVAPWGTGPFGKLPLGAFFSVAVEMEK